AVPCHADRLRPRTEHRLTSGRDRQRVDGGESHTSILKVLPARPRWLHRAGWAHRVRTSALVSERMPADHVHEDPHVSRCGERIEVPAPARGTGHLELAHERVVRGLGLAAPYTVNDRTQACQIPACPLNDGGVGAIVLVQRDSMT